MIVGIKTDIVEIEKLRLAMVGRGERLRNRAFTESEIAYCEERASRYQHYAARFAAYGLNGRNPVESVSADLSVARRLE